MPYERIHDRPGNLELAKSMNELIIFIEDEGTGNLKKDRALWTLRKGFNADTARKQWQTLFEAEALAENSGSYQKLPLFYVLLEKAREDAGGQAAAKKEKADSKPDLDMSSPTPFTDYADLKEINETRGNLGLPPLPFARKKR